MWNAPDVFVCAGVSCISVCLHLSCQEREQKIDFEMILTPSILHTHKKR